MFCSSCGKPAAPGQAACAYCHAPLAFAAAPGGYPGNPPVYPVYQSRVARHIQLMGALWAVRGLLPLFGWLVAIPFLRHFAGFYDGQWGHGDFGPWSFFHSPFWISFITTLVLLHAALSLTTAYALLTRQPWGRILAIIASILGLLRIPFGTALSIYTLIILLPADAGAEYDALAVRSH